MKANKANLLQFLFKSGHLEVPEYQRGYGWSLKECKQLFDDIKDSRDGDVMSHFFGSIIYVEKGTSQISSTNICYIVDGSQRLVTLSLLLLAISDAVKETNPESSLIELIKEKYVLNSDEGGRLRYKIGLNSNADMETYTTIADGREELPRVHSSNILENYLYFTNLIKESGIEPKELLAGLKKFEIIDIALQKEVDDAYSVYSTSNSSTLSQSDRIRCFIHRQIDEDVFSTYWNSMEDMFSEAQTPCLFERYIADYVTIHNNGEIPSDDEIHSSFKKVFSEKLKYQQSKDVIKHIYQYSKYFIRLNFAEESDIGIKQYIDRINQLNAEVAYPFLLEVYDDYENELINRETFIDILKMVEGYLLRRNIKHPSNASPALATLSREIGKLLGTNMKPSKKTISKIENNKDYDRTVEHTLSSIDKINEKHELRVQKLQSLPIERCKPKNIRELEEKVEDEPVKEYSRNPFSLLSR